LFAILNDGRDSDLSSLSSGSCTEERFPENEFQHLLNEVGNDDFMDLMNDIGADDDEEEENAIDVNTLNDADNGPIDMTIQNIHPSVNEVRRQNSESSINWMSYKAIGKRDIKWSQIPFSQPALFLEPVELPNYPKKILTPLDYFSKYFSENDFASMSKFTNIYAEQKLSTNFKTCSASEIKILVAIHMMFGVLKYPRTSMYWQEKYRVNIVADNMTRNRFYELRSMFHVMNNLDIPPNNSDKFIKVRPLYNIFLRRCSELPVEQYLCVDEQIVPYKGKLAIKQYIKGKPTPWGIKNFLLCGASGIVYNLYLYQGSTPDIHPDALKIFGLGGSVVLKLVENLKQNTHFLFFDNFFSNYNLFGCLLQNKIYAAGTIRVNRFANPPFISDKQLSKMARGTSFEVTSNNKIGVLKWYDNKAVNMASNFILSGEPKFVKRYDRKLKNIVEIEQPEVIQLYNTNMGGVDKHDQMVSYYRTFLKSKKWTLRALFHVFDMTVVNCWLEYKQDAANLDLQEKDIMDLLAFKQRLAESLMLVGMPFSPARKRGRPSRSSEQSFEELPEQPRRKNRPVDQTPLEEVTQDGFHHFPMYDERKEAIRCKRMNCRGRTHVQCTKCRVHLCFTKKTNCFFDFHQ